MIGEVDILRSVYVIAPDSLDVIVDLCIDLPRDRELLDGHAGSSVENAACST